jgi:hypothetical protein
MKRSRSCRPPIKWQCYTKTPTIEVVPISGEIQVSRRSIGAKTEAA